MKRKRNTAAGTAAVTVAEAEIGWDGRLLGPARVFLGVVDAADGGNADAAALLAADRVDELRLTLHPRLGGPGSGDAGATGTTTGTLTDGGGDNAVFPPRSTAWRLVRMVRGAGGVCRLRYVRQREAAPA